MPNSTVEYAFPSPEWSDAHGNIAPMDYGMTLRDYFAAKAMQAVWLKLDPDAVRSLSVSQTATTAYDMADAMLEERNRK